jgi:YVTN family beta-propeller protein
MDNARFVEICVGLEINGYLPAVMAFTPDEKILLTTNGVSNDVSIIDVPALKVRAIAKSW